jgi:hypothetical protein
MSCLATAESRDLPAHHADNRASEVHVTLPQRVTNVSDALCSPSKDGPAWRQHGRYSVRLPFENAIVSSLHTMPESKIDISR